MGWDSISPRACKPPPTLTKGTNPVVGTAEHAINSPLPYGLGIYALDSNGAQRRPLPLYYVPPKAAAARASRSVQPGWYVVAEPGVQFELVVTAVRPDFPNLGGVKLEEGHWVDAYVYADGICFKCCRMSRSGSERVADGFVETEECEADGEVKKTVRRFKFKKAETTGDEGGTVGSNDAGSIFVEMFSGKLVKRQRSMIAVSNDLSKFARKIGEKDAVKNGKSITVGMDGARVTRRSRPSGHVMMKSKSVGSFTIFLREKFWMMSRQIIDKDGNLWAPSLKVVDVDVDEQSEPAQPPKKKVKREVVDLTKPTIAK